MIPPPKKTLLTLDKYSSFFTVISFFFTIHNLTSFHRSNYAMIIFLMCLQIMYSMYMYEKDLALKRKFFLNFNFNFNFILFYKEESKTTLAEGINIFIRSK